ncbi:dirigent protein 1 [Phtheirospermum japonicum]|uniref:Dirigent protein n=1 Tax=Phtheirospermum japonicum TaxID=374723 RepID=A0A830BL10_9LAMI|nr:dirigent protein 1 [Phtheirospermum japonicum]
MGKLARFDSLMKSIKGAYSGHGMSHNHDDPNNTEEKEEKFKKLLKAKQKVAKLHFYLQDALGGPSATVYEVARSDITATSAASFGQVRVLDDLITARPDRDSQHLGRAQGMITFTGLDESALTMSLNFYFTAGEYSGSTLCVVGRNPIGSKNRELPVVGGTGVFRMARGYSISNTYSYDAATNYGVLEYTVYVAYVDED